MNWAFMRCRRLLSITLFLASTLSEAGFAADLSTLRTWIKAQGEIVSLRGAFSQERKIKVLHKTLVAPGRFWYQAPDQFRWEIGVPARSIAIHSRDTFTMIDVEKGKAEVQDMVGGDDNSRMVAYFQLSFPRDWASFQQEFKVLSVVESGDVLQAELEPLRPGSARGVRTITFEIDPKSYATRAFVLSLKDGSEMRTSFSGVERDVPLPGSTFDVSLDGLRVKEKGN
jgi:outer membrane lipoprotein-sorting protein